MDNFNPEVQQVLNGNAPLPKQPEDVQFYTFEEVVMMVRHGLLTIREWQAYLAFLRTS